MRNNPAIPAREGRWTRSRTKLLAAQKTVPEEPAPADGGPVGKRPRVENVPKLEPAPVKRTRSPSAAELALAARPLPPRYPAYPRTGKTEDILKHNAECKRIHKAHLPDSLRRGKLPTCNRKFDSDTAASFKSLKDKRVCLDAGRSVVAVSSTGEGGTAHYSSGVVIDSCEGDEPGSARILTSSGVHRLIG